MIATSWLINTSITSHSYLYWGVRMLKIYSLRKLKYTFEVYY